MAVMVPREKWTDERLDDLQAEMRAGFAEVKGEIKRLDDRGAGVERKVERLDGRIAGVEREMKRLDVDFRELRREVNSMNRNMMAGFFAMIAAIIASNAF
jgi:chaperonin cofactor prefoldin